MVRSSPRSRSRKSQDYRLRRRGYLRRLYRNQSATLKALADGDIDFAYLWANAGWTLPSRPSWRRSWRSSRAIVPEDRWKIAVAMRRGDDELKRHVDAALGALIARRDRRRVPWPATTCRTPPAPGPPAAIPRAAPAELIRHAVAEQAASLRCSKSRRPGIPIGPGPSPLGRRAGGGPGPEQPPLFDGPPRAGRARLRDRRPARRGARRLAPGLLGHLRARLLPLEAGDQTALRRDPRRHARRSVRASGSSIRGRITCAATGRSSGRATVRPRNGSRWPSRRASRCAGLKGRRCSRIPAPRRSWRPSRRAARGRAT